MEAGPSHHQAPGGNRPLLLAPGGDEECARAAILAGADAVYLGLPRWNARMRATNIEEPALRQLVRLAHQHGSRIYLTMNTLLAQSELAAALETAERAGGFGVDALILQDWGLLAALGDLAERGKLPAELHASTQMTTHNAPQLEVLAAFGVSQVILARELELAEVRDLTGRARELGMRTEVFVHGAYCVSVSGQCSMSSIVAGRSGNRGECAQPCRRPYRVEGGGRTFPLSPKDCALYASLGDLARCGVSGLKIEGRMKGADYVYTVVRAYRRELDSIAGGGPGSGWDASLDKVFSRGFSDGYLKGKLSADLFGGEPFDASLEPAGTVRGFTADSMLLRLEGAPVLAPGDLLSILSEDRALLVCRAAVLREAARDTFEVRIEGELKGRITRGCLAFRHPCLPEVAEARARALAMRVLPEEIRAGVAGEAGVPLRVTFAARGRAVSVESSSPLGTAERRPLGEETLRSALGRLGGSPFVLGGLETNGLQPGLFLPVSELNDLRRRAVDLLERPEPPPPRPRMRAGSPPSALELPRFGVILSDASQAAVFASRGVAVFLSMAEPAAAFDPAACIPLFPAVLFDAQIPRCLEVVSRPGVRAVVTSNVGLGLECSKRGVPWVAGPHANVTNGGAAQALRDFAGASAFFHSPELDVAQIREGPGPLPSLLLVAGPMLAMTTRSCIVRNVAGCARGVVDPSCLGSCSRSAVMRDEAGRPFYVEKRPGRHTEIYNGSFLWYPQAVRALADGVRCFVLDLRDLSFVDLAVEAKLSLLDACERALAGEADAGTGAKLYGSVTRGGFGRGL
jgi:U32 family peptidase